MIRRTITALLVALVASFALSSPASAATKKTARPRVKHSSHAAAATRTKPAVKKEEGCQKEDGHVVHNRQEVRQDAETQTDDKAALRFSSRPSALSHRLSASA